ncbi:hypothetical protein M569_00423, partial [Genlisea aurea]
IAFYLLLRSEGQPVRDHPVVSRLVEIKTLVDKAKEMDKIVPVDVNIILKTDVTTKKLAETNAEVGYDFLTNNHATTKEHVEVYNKTDRPKTCRSLIH